MPGLILLGLGVVFLLRELDIIEGDIFFQGWWAWILIVLGLSELIRARRAGDVDSGVTLVLLGTWLYLVMTGWHQLTFRNSWPVVLVAVGAGMVARSIAAHWLPEGRGHRRHHRHHDRHHDRDLDPESGEGEAWRPS